jgi:hypothetical protein
MAFRMKRRSVVSGAAAMALLASVRALGNPRRPMRRVALVFGIPPAADIAGPDPANANARAIVHQLRDLGLVEGRDIVIDRRTAEGKGPARVGELIREVVDFDVDVIVTRRGVRRDRSPGRRRGRERGGASTEPRFRAFAGWGTLRVIGCPMEYG